MCEVVHAGIPEVIHKFQYMSNIGNLEEYFYCMFCSNKTTEHFCQLKKDKKHSYAVKAVLLMLLIKLVSNLGFSLTVTFDLL